jgi:hypothetical protein
MIFVIDRLFGYYYPAYQPYLNKNTHSWDSYATNYRGYFHDSKVDAEGRTYFTIDRSGEKDRKYDGVRLDSNAIQIVTLGDSFTAGQGVRLSDTYCKRLERVKSDRKIYGINLAKAGADIPEVYEQMTTQMGGYHPSLIIYGYVLNDPLVEPNPGVKLSEMEINPELDQKGDSGLGWDFMNLRSPAIRSLRQGVLKWLGENSRIADFILADLELKRISKSTIQYYQDIHNPEKNSKGLEETFDKIEKMNQIAKSMGSRFLVVIFPIFYQNNANYPFAEAHRYLMEQLAKRGVNALDLQPAYSHFKSEALWVHPVDQHPNDFAQEIAAEQIERWIRANSTLLSSNH